MSVSSASEPVSRPRPQSTPPAPAIADGSDSASLRTIADLAEELRTAVARINRRLRSENPGGVTPAQLTVLLTLDRSGEQTLGSLAEIVMVSPPSMNRTVSHLVEAGLVEREQSQTDRRVTRLRITASGRAEADRTRAHRDEWLGRQLAALTVEQRAELGRAAAYLSEVAAR
ncbi:MAG: MarR family winged helix-turn-helix transcriptional regulator [Pseudoclavibacter sp.]